MSGSFTSGLGAQLGLGAETTYATAVTVNRFQEFASESMKLNRAFLLSQQLRAGRMFQSSSRRSATTRSAAGDASFEVPSQGFGPWLNLLHGNTVVPVQQGATKAYLQTHNIGATDPFSKSVTLQVGRPTDAGVVNPFTYPGTVATALELACQTGGFLEAKVTLDANDEQTATALATAAVPTGLHSFNFTQVEVKINGVKQEQVRGFTATISTPKDTGRYYMGKLTKANPLTNAYNGGAMSLTVDYGDNSLYELFAGASVVPVEIKIVGPLIESAFHEELTLKMEACGLDGDSPVVSGPGVLGQQIPFVVLDDGTHVPIIATYQSTDITL
jgi:Phage tail tube protein